MSTDMELATRLAIGAAELRDVRVRAAELEEELTELSYELARGTLGDRAVVYLRGKVTKALGVQPRGEISARHLFSALEDAWCAGAFAERGGVPGPAPVTRAETEEADRRGT